MKHKDKKRLARRLREQEANTAVNYYRKQNYNEGALKAIRKKYMKQSIWLSLPWTERKNNKKIRVSNREALAQQRKANIAI